MSNEQKNYDVVVIGAGSGGLTSAIGFAKVGKKVLLVEKEHMGGECTNTGCVPSKALLHHAKKYHTATTVAGKSTESETYRKKAFAYVRNTIDGILAEETPEKVSEHGVDVVLGEAVFHTPCSIEVNGQVYGYKRAVIATGSSPRPLTTEGLEEKDVLTNQNIFTLDDVPNRLLVIGSGPIGMEMGQAFALLGSKVTIASIDSRFAKLEDEAISPIIEKKFTDLGITILKSAFINRVENKDLSAGGTAQAEAIFDIKKKDTVVSEERVAYDKVLVAIGRAPNLPKGLDVAGIKTEKYGIMVDSQYRTSNKYVYALGDVSQRLKFTHTADDTARQVITRVISRGLFRVNTKKAVPKVTYTQPEIAAVGLSYADARKKYNDAEIMKIEVPYTQNDRAKTDDNTDGMLVVVVRRVNGAILGANMIGTGAGELIALFTLAIDQKISMWKLQKQIYAYPTYALLIKKAGDQFFARQIQDLKPDLMHLVKKHTPKIIALLFWGTLLYFFQHYRITNDLSYKDMTLLMFHFFTGTMWGPFAYIVLYAIRPLIFFPATLLTALSGALFGLWYGILYTILGENASANFAYWIGRFFGKDLRLEDSFIGNWVHALHKRPFAAILFMRLFYVPFDLTNYGAGILRVKWPSYFFATLIGILPGLTTFVALGAAISIEELQMDGLTFNAFDPKFIGLSVAVFAASLLLAKVLKKWQAEKETTDS